MKTLSATEIQVAILAQRKPPCTQLDVELPDGQVERVVLGTGRYRASAAASTVVALQGVAMRLLSRDGSVLRAMRLREVEQAPLPLPLVSSESDMDRALRIVGEIYARAHKQEQESAAATAAATAAEREMAAAGMMRAMEVMAAALERGAQQLADLHARERETSVREIEVTAAAAAEAGPAEAAATVMRELPAAMPALMQLAALAKDAMK